MTAETCSCDLRGRVWKPSKCIYFYRTPVKTFILDKITVAQLVKKLPVVYAKVFTLDIVPYPEPDVYSSHPHTLFI
jgi:hypothetical protein